MHQQRNARSRAVTDRQRQGIGQVHARRDEVARVITVAPLLAQLERLDKRASHNPATMSTCAAAAQCDLSTRLLASVLIARAGYGRLLSSIRELVHERACALPEIRDAAVSAAAAAAFADILGPETVAALSLPWALTAVLAR
jgi:hypothetical protein